MVFTYLGGSTRLLHQVQCRRRRAPEVTDLDIALEPWKKVYLPVVLK
jgi:hypothetical protein